MIEMEKEIRVLVAEITKLSDGKYRMARRIDQLKTGVLLQRYESYIHNR
jgi:hypothetical protein